MNSLQELLAELERRRKYRKIASFFPDKGKDDYSDPESSWSRDLYPRQLEFFSAGAKYRQRLFSAGNRSGKTIAGAVEMTYHLTGLYPDWWQGRRFTYPVNAWVVGQTSETVQKILQETYLGPVGDFGSGMVPRELLDLTTLPAATKVGVSVPGFKVKHSSGGYSSVAFKSQEQGVLAFTGTSLDLVHADEPLKLTIYSEICTRLAVRDGSLIITSTPILGLDDFLLNFCGGEWKLGEVDRFRYIVSATWDEIPHLLPEVKAQLLASYPAYQRECRSKGVPMLGQGAVFPFAAEQITVPDFEIPKTWAFVDGLDVGWRCTARVGIAVNPDTRESFVYRIYAQGELRPIEHRRNWEGIPDWIPIKIDPAAHGRGQADGQMIFDQLEEMGLKVENADNAREASILRITELFSAGKLKIFASACRDLVSELLNLSRLENGKIRDASDKHLTDAFRYAVMGLDDAKTAVQAGVGGYGGDISDRWALSNRRW